MKKRLQVNLLALFTMLFFPVSAQDLYPGEVVKVNVEVRHEPDTIVTFDKTGLPLNRFAYLYDLDGNKTSEVQERYEKENWVNVLRTTQTFDDSNRMLTQLRETFKDGLWTNMNRTIQTFDEPGNMLTQTVEMWRTDAWGGNNRTTQTFDVKGNRLTQLMEVWQNNQWTNSAQNMWTYDEAGNMLTRKMDSWVNGAWVENSYTKFTYDSSNNLITESKAKDNLDITRITYTYNGNDQILSKIEENYSGNAVWVNFNRYTWVYDEAGNISVYLTEGWANNAWGTTQRETYTYDSQKNMLTKVSERKSGAAMTNNMRYTWTYNTSGKQLSQLEERWMTDNWTLSTKNTWSYDSAGNLLGSLIEAWRQGEWVKTLDLNYSYDEKGNGTLFEASLINNQDVSIYYNNSKSKCTLPGYNVCKATAKYIEIKENVAVTGITIKQEVVSLSVGQTIRIEVAVTPSNATNKELEWTSSATEIAAVNENGVITAVAPGKAIITIKTVEGNFTATCEVTVNAAVTGVALNETELSLTIGESFQLEATVNPPEAGNKDVRWKTSAVAYVSVDSSGLITAVRKGEATITVTTAEGAFKATCKVTVNPTSIDETQAAGTKIYVDKKQILINDASITTRIYIFDSNGEEMFRANHSVSSIDASQWAAGIYIIRTTDKAGKHQYNKICIY